MFTKTKHRIVAHETGPECKIEKHHFASNKELQEEIEKKAYELYESRGCIPGRELDDWLEAERMMNNRIK